MMNPEKLIQDLFDDKNLSDANLRGFSEDMLQRMSLPVNNPGGIYSQLITDTSTRFTTFFGLMTNTATKKAISEGLTVTMNATKSDLLSYMSSLQGLVKFRFSETSATYQEFYPQGMSEYHDANLAQLPMLIDRFQNAANTHLTAAETGPLTARITAFTNARAAQTTVFAEVETLQTGKRADRKLLTLQLTTNMLTIALNNLDNADNYNNYYNPSYLPLTDKAFSVNGLIAPSSIITAVNEGVITQSSSVTLYNNGDDELVFSVSDQPGIMHPSYSITIAAGNSSHLADLPVLERYYVVIQNNAPTSTGKWKVKVG
jgi:hypothetical protein